MKNTWVISDTHFNHAAILTFKDYAGKPPREFDNVDQMNEAMFDNWNDVIKSTDTVYHLGDVLFGPDKVKWLENNEYLKCGPSMNVNELEKKTFEHIFRP